MYPKVMDGRLSSFSVTTTISTTIGDYLRKRDAVAILVCILFLRLAFSPIQKIYDGGEFTSRRIDASMTLAFYYPFQPHVHRILGQQQQATTTNQVDDRPTSTYNEAESRRTARPVPLDIDGDGIFDSLVIPVFLTREEVIQEEQLVLKWVVDRPSQNHYYHRFTQQKKEENQDSHHPFSSNDWSMDGSWGIRIVDLRPLHRSSHHDNNDGSKLLSFYDGPFAPRTIFLSPLLLQSSSSSSSHHPSSENKEDGSTASHSQHPQQPSDTRTILTTVFPMKLLSIQIPIQRTHLGEEEKFRQRHKKDGTTATAVVTSTSGNAGSYGKNPNIPSKEDPRHQNYDRTRHYFCGRDWHHAAQSCHRHCGGGTSSECGEGETCYADTPCDVFLSTEASDDTSNSGEEETTTSLALTKGGTLPGIVGIWSDGSVTLHVITTDIPTNKKITTASSSSSSSSRVNNAAGKQHQQHRAKRTMHQIHKTPELELRQLWRAYPFKLNFYGSDSSQYENDVYREDIVIDFDEFGLTFESGAMTAGFDISSEQKMQKRQFGENGAIIVGGRYTLQSHAGQNPTSMSFHALDALTGKPLWNSMRSHHNNMLTAPKEKGNNEPRVPIIHTTSSARRRSHLPVMDDLDPELDSESAFAEGDDSMTSEQCMNHFRASLMNAESGALPHEFWDNGEYGSINVGRFDRHKEFAGKRRNMLGKRALHFIKNMKNDGPRVQSDGGIGGGKISTSTVSSSSTNKSWQSDLIQRAIPQHLINQQLYNSRNPHFGKPNVVFFHGREGLAVLSLKNGLPVCHMSLMDHSLYADVDQDGVIDTIQVITTPESSNKNSAVKNLIHRISGEAREQQAHADAPAICHALVTSGLPPREEMFTTPLCLGGDTNPSRLHISAAPPLLVEGSVGYGNDVVFAMNNGVVSRYNFNGQEVWRKRGSVKDGTPSWNPGQFAAFLGRVQFSRIREPHSSVSASSHRNQHRPGSPARPILLSGEDGAILLSTANGKKLCSVVYPQSVVSQPLLVDLTGDGTDDLLVVSNDAIWGYRIVVETGRSGGFVIVVVTLLVGVALAALIHTMNHQPGHPNKRSTDI